MHDGERLVLQNINYAPGLFKIFDEILVNAADNKARDPTMDTVKVDIDVVGGAGRASPSRSLAPQPCARHAQQTRLPSQLPACTWCVRVCVQASNTIKVWNNGDGIPVEVSSRPAKPQQHPERDACRSAWVTQDNWQWQQHTTGPRSPTAPAAAGQGTAGTR